jgi:hypothetical protein
MFFTFPEDARWNAERQAVEFGVEIGEGSRRGPGPAVGVSTTALRAARPRAGWRSPPSRAKPVRELL